MTKHVCLGVAPCEDCRNEGRCEFYRERDGEVLWACASTDTTCYVMYDGGDVVLCDKHRSWLPALGKAV